MSASARARARPSTRERVRARAQARPRVCAVCLNAPCGASVLAGAWLELFGFAVFGAMSGACLIRTIQIRRHFGARHPS
eukprot:9659057-Alexandrium_andersonii.AAC.1